MKRLANAPRAYWRADADRLGADYLHGDETCSWREDVCYAFDETDIVAIETATQTLHGMCAQMVDHVVRHTDMLDRFCVPVPVREHLARCWHERAAHPHLLGRFDFGFDPASGAVKMLEYNADTPSTAIETATVQWQWLQQTRPADDQFNMLHDAIIERFRDFRMLGALRGERIHVAPHPNSLEDYRHAEYYVELARQAGIEAHLIALKDVGLRRGTFVDLYGRPIRTLLKTYPWEMLVQDPFMGAVIDADLQVIEPLWKMLLSNKAALPTLWEMFPGHPNLLRAQWSPDGMVDHVEKPVFSREGQNIRIVANGTVVAETGGTYGDYPKVFQERFHLPEFGGRPVVIGSWMVGDELGGMLVREGDGLILQNASAAVPHFIDRTTTPLV